MSFSSIGQKGRIDRPLPRSKRQLVDRDEAAAQAAVTPIRSLSEMVLTSPCGQTTGHSIPFLPLELVAHILNFLNGREVKRCQCVSSQW